MSITTPAAPPCGTNHSSVLARSTGTLVILQSYGISSLPCTLGVARPTSLAFLTLLRRTLPSYSSCCIHGLATAHNIDKVFAMIGFQGRDGVESTHHVNFPRELGMRRYLVDAGLNQQQNNAICSSNEKRPMCRLGLSMETRAASDNVSKDNPRTNKT